ncbi:T9SS type A sorting domain-containing protein, partial [Candidatus Dependentiae bacterium]|nr:T9SS type A sorting domain-containing protein [Candidatus Dependentiae bacterium]
GLEQSAAPYSSGPDTTPPVFEGIKNIVDLKDGKSLTLEWDQATDPEGSNPITYNVYYSIHSGGQYFDVPSYTTTNTSSLTITDLTKGQAYYFIVRAEDSLNNEESNLIELEGIPTKSGTPPPPPPEPGTVKIYPNPAKGSDVSIVIEDSAFSSISIYSLNGDLVAEINSGITLISNNQAVLETENLGSGIYFFVIKDASGKMHTGKLGIIN